MAKTRTTIKTRGPGKGTTLPIRTIAHLVAVDLFTSGSGGFADRLVAMTNGGRDMGGWGFTAMRDRIEKIIKDADDATK